MSQTQMASLLCLGTCVLLRALLHAGTESFIAQFQERSLALEVADHVYERR